MANGVQRKTAQNGKEKIERKKEKYRNKQKMPIACGGVVTQREKRGGRRFVISLFAVLKSIMQQASSLWSKNSNGKSKRNQNGMPTEMAMIRDRR